MTADEETALVLSLGQSVNRYKAVAKSIGLLAEEALVLYALYSYNEPIPLTKWERLEMQDAKSWHYRRHEKHYEAQVAARMGIV